MKHMALSGITPLTDDRGRSLCGDFAEPRIGSVVLTSGIYGTAWQRLARDGKWHSTTGLRMPWKFMCARRNLVLVYDAPEREEPLVHPAHDTTNKENAS